VLDNAFFLIDGAPAIEACPGSERHEHVSTR
jgi:hypothetical protein